MRRTPWMFAGVLASASGCLGGEVRDQLVVVIDTDLPVEPGSIPVATVDTLRVDVYASGATTPKESRELVVARRDAWPLSLGAVGPVRVRLRLFAARWAGTVANDAGTAREPRPEVTIDRLIDVTAPDGVVHVRVLLSGDCLGRAADLVRGRTCVGAGALDVAANGTPDADDGSATRAASWANLRELPCTSADDATRPCVPGGYDVLGDPALAGLDSLAAEPLPLRPVVVSPVRMDRLEYSVGRYRALALSGKAPAAAPLMSAECTYRGTSDASADALPLTCVSATLAAALCGVDGGRLPTEAEWEHAASGRGRGDPYPWGTTDPKCCTTSLSRSPRPQDTPLCGGRSLPEAGGSHDGSGCAGVGDVSRDGIADLGGSVLELTADDFAPVSTCTTPGVRRDPSCSIGAATRLFKSADWTSGILRARVALRVEGYPAPSPLRGFRCVYPEPR